MFDLKTLHATLDQIEEEKRISKEQILHALEEAIAAAYKKDYGKRGQIIRSHFNTDTGELEFEQVKIAVDDSMVKPELAEGEEPQEEENGEDERVRFNPEHHIYINDAKLIKTDVQLGEELIFPLENPLDRDKEFGRVAAQTARQVIIQKIREAERESIMKEYADMEGEVLTGTVQKVERGNVYVDFERATGIVTRNEQIPGEFFKTGDRIKVYLYGMDEERGGVQLRLSRSHPGLVAALFALESPEVASGTVEIKTIAREAGSRSKMAVWSHDENIDPVGACVGQRGVRILTVMNSLNGEKVDVIPWSEDKKEFIKNSLAPAKILGIELDEHEMKAHIEVTNDQLSLAIGKGGQNVRLAAKLTGWRIDIAESESEENSEGEDGKEKDEEEPANEIVEEAPSEEVVEEKEKNTPEEGEKE